MQLIGFAYPIIRLKPPAVNLTIEDAPTIYINEPRLESDRGYRFQYLSEFMGFGPHDLAAIHAAAPALTPLVPTVVNAVYDQLNRYDATWRRNPAKPALR